MNCMHIFEVTGGGGSVYLYKWLLPARLPVELNGGDGEKFAKTTGSGRCVNTTASTASSSFPDCLI